MITLVTSVYRENKRFPNHRWYSDATWGGKWVNGLHLNMCLQKWFQRKMWNYDKINNSRSWIVCISITLIKCETVNLFLFSLNTLPNKKCIAVWQVKNDIFKYWLIMSYFVQIVQTAIFPHTQPCICKHDKWYSS